MGIWDAIANGTVPTLEDVQESGSNLYDTGAGLYDDAAETVNEAGRAIGDGAEYVVDGAVDLGNEALGYGERALDATYHGLTDWHFEARDAANRINPEETASLPTQEGVPNAGGWTRQPELYGRLHQDQDTPGTEVKYVNADGREYIGHEDGSEVTRGDIRGTYNYVNPGIWDDDLENQSWVELGDNAVADAAEWLVEGASDLTGAPVGGALEMGGRLVGHTVADVLPWIVGGSVRDDDVDEEREGGVVDRIRILTGL